MAEQGEGAQHVRQAGAQGWGLCCGLPGDLARDSVMGKEGLGLVLHLTAWRSCVNGPERKRRWLTVGKS